MQSVFVTITKLIALKNYLCKEFFCNNFGRNGTIVSAVDALHALGLADFRYFSFGL